MALSTSVTPAHPSGSAGLLRMIQLLCPAGWGWGSVTAQTHALLSPLPHLTPQVGLQFPMTRLELTLLQGQAVLTYEQHCEQS